MYYVRRSRFPCSRSPSAFAHPSPVVPKSRDVVITLTMFHYQREPLNKIIGHVAWFRILSETLPGADKLITANTFGLLSSIAKYIRINYHGQINNSCHLFLTEFITRGWLIFLLQRNFRCWETKQKCFVCFLSMCKSNIIGIPHFYFNIYNYIIRMYYILSRISYYIYNL